MTCKKGTKLHMVGKKKGGSYSVEEGAVKKMGVGIEAQ